MSDRHAGFYRCRCVVPADLDGVVARTCPTHDQALLVYMRKHYYPPDDRPERLRTIRAHYNGSRDAFAHVAHKAGKGAPPYSWWVEEALAMHRLVGDLLALIDEGAP